jgi:pimeloyl-ACP methyl ester carboxylesterase
VSRTPIVLVHGAWHGSWCYAPVALLLAAAGRTATAVDMAGHGLNAVLPASFATRPFDPAAFATERSPLAGVTLEAAANMLVGQIESITAGDGRCVLVGHSMGGHVISAAAQRAPHLVERLVYLAAFMPAPGVAAGTYVASPENAGEAVGPLLVGAPGAIGALRIDTRSADPGYRAGIVRAFYADVPPAAAEATIHLLTPDQPLGIPAAAVELTAAAWGSVPRTYVLCTRDESVLPALQRRFVAEADAAFPANPTRVVEVDASHSPFLSVPDRVAAAILAE